jgi:putative oxidoreductase
MLADQGFWHMAHESRTDWSMTLGALFLLIVGAGAWSIDARLATRR